jgi:hypothetical protein
VRKNDARPHLRDGIFPSGTIICYRSTTKDVPRMGKALECMRQHAENFSQMRAFFVAHLKDFRLEALEAFVFNRFSFHEKQ